jgi:Uma2 family endonuclease
MNATALLEADPTRAEVLADDSSYEIVHGERVEIPPMSAYASLIASRLGIELGSVAKTARLGQVAVEVLFHLPLEEDQGRNRKPDVAFVSSERWPLDRPMKYRGNAWDVVPDLAVEVLSPYDLAEDILGKVVEYFRAGVRLVWVVSPALSQVLAWDSPTAVRVLRRADTLDGGPVLPDFRLPLGQLFDEIDPEIPEPRPDDA